MNKIRIKNRKEQEIAVLVEVAAPQKGLVFVMHGLGGFKEQDHIQVMTESFKETNFTAIRFDTTNTLGESDGSYEQATVTSYYEDLEDVIQWAKTQAWYQEPFVLVGSSLGGMCITLFAEKYPEKVLALAPTSAVVTGALTVEAEKKRDPNRFVEWERTGWRENESLSKPGIIKRLPWSHIADRLKYDLLHDAHKLTMPTLVIVGECDTLTPPEHIQILYNALPGPKELHIIKDAPHTFRDPMQLQEVKIIFLNWIKSFSHHA